MDDFEQLDMDDEQDGVLHPSVEAVELELHLDESDDDWEMSLKDLDEPQEQQSPARSLAHIARKRQSLHQGDISPAPALHPSATQTPSPKRQRARSPPPPPSPVSSIPQLPTPSPEPEISQAEMDRFLGFVPDPVPVPVVVGVAAALVPPASPARLTAAEKGKGREKVTGKSAMVALQVPAVVTTAPLKRRVFTDPPSPIHQLTQISLLSPSGSGEPISREEKRLAIIKELQLITLSVLTQLVDSTFLPPTLPPNQKGNADSDALPRAKAIVVLAKRTGGRSSNADADADEEDIEVASTRVSMFPRKTGNTNTNLNGGNFELILDGLLTKTVSTKRDLYYRAVKIFLKQSRVDSIIEDLAATLRVRREDLNIVAAPKGLFGGFIQIYTRDGKCVVPGELGALIPPSVAIERIACDNVKWVLVIEKEVSLLSPPFAVSPSLTKSKTPLPPQLRPFSNPSAPLPFSQTLSPRSPASFSQGKVIPIFQPANSSTLSPPPTHPYHSSV
ncbi:hypothetical protein P7C70_g3324, partial [Phenoliferia sp. Uapishka_3]